MHHYHNQWRFMQSVNFIVNWWIYCTKSTDPKFIFGLRPEGSYMKYVWLTRHVPFSLCNVDFLNDQNVRTSSKNASIMYGWSVLRLNRTTATDPSNNGRHHTSVNFLKFWEKPGSLHRKYVDKTKHERRKREKGRGWVGRLSNEAWIRPGFGESVVLRKTKLSDFPNLIITENLVLLASFLLKAVKGCMLEFFGLFPQVTKVLRVIATLLKKTGHEGP